MEITKKIKTHARLLVQIIFTALSNGYALGFAEGKIYQGASKQVCVPGLNCYSCPGAIASCPIGSLQAVIGSKDYNFSFYIVGFLMITGSLLGRFVCGWLCPFGLVQDLLYKIPFVKKIKNVPFDRRLRYLKYLILAIFVFAMPLLLTGYAGYGSPWFCKLICPSGTLFAGLPLITTNPGFQKALGFLFGWKTLVLIVTIIGSSMIYRPFCKYICPLGAIYSPFNKFSLYRYEVDARKCTGCGICTQACQMGIRAYVDPNSPECIRCGKCLRACPTKAINTTLRKSMLL